MSPTFSIYLDLIRFLAALAVFVHHVSIRPFTDGSVWWPLRPYGDIAVTIFFVLSGYVIAYVSSTRERTAAHYVSARVARLYSVAVIALLLTWVFDHIGMAANPGFYQIKQVLWKPESWEGYLSSLFFVNEYQIFHFNGIAPGTDGPYWSMSFEATYYVIAGLMLFGRRLIAVGLSMLILWVAGTTIAAMLPIWALGYWLYRTDGKLKLGSTTALLLSVASAIFLMVLPHLAVHLPSGNFGISFPWGRGPFERNLLVDYLAAFGFAIHLVSVRSLDSSLSNLMAPLAPFARWLGTLTFPLYCIHVPVICLLAAISPWARSSLVHLGFLTVVTASIVAVITPLCEAIKNLLRSRMMAFSANAATAGQSKGK